jgi:hypothetical protein
MLRDTEDLAVVLPHQLLVRRCITPARGLNQRNVRMNFLGPLCLDS